MKRTCSPGCDSFSLLKEPAAGSRPVEVAEANESPTPTVEHAGSEGHDADEPACEYAAETESSEPPAAAEHSAVADRSSTGPTKSGAATEEESIDDYMARLLVRMRGGAEPEEKKPAVVAQSKPRESAPPCACRAGQGRANRHDRPRERSRERATGRYDGPGPRAGAGEIGRAFDVAGANDQPRGDARSWPTLPPAAQSIDIRNSIALGLRSSELPSPRYRLPSGRGC